MKITNKSGKVNSTASQEKHAFGIGDVGVVIEILRNRLYSNPIQTLTQEYLSNGRDATREAGSKKALLVTLPTKLDSVLKIRDFGPGLSPERVKEVFVLYGASTKRKDNSQTGGFGIGAKSAWAYTDSFTVISYHNKKARTYVAHTGENANGTFELLEEESTKEPNGVEIQIPVKSEDREKFKSAVFRCTYFWETRPDFKGIILQEIPEWYQNKTPIISGSGWGVFNLPSTWGLSKKSEEYEDYRDLDGLFVVDGIPYEVPEVIVESNEFGELKESFASGQVVIYFNTGDIEVSASREAVVLDQKNTKLIYKKFSEVMNDVDKTLEKELKSVNDLPSALKKLEDVCQIFNSSVFSDKSWTGTLDKKKVKISVNKHYWNSTLLDISVDGLSNYAWEMKSTYRSAKLRTQVQTPAASVLSLAVGKDNYVYVYNESEELNKVQDKIKRYHIAANQEVNQYKYLNLVSGVDAQWLKKHLPMTILSGDVSKPERKKSERKSAAEGTVNIHKFNPATNSFPKVNLNVKDLEESKVISLTLKDGSYWRNYGDDKYSAILNIAEDLVKEGFTVVGATAAQVEDFPNFVDLKDYLKTLPKKKKVSRELKSSIEWHAWVSLDRGGGGGYYRSGFDNLDVLSSHGAKIKDKSLVTAIKTLNPMDQREESRSEAYCVLFKELYSEEKAKAKEHFKNLSGFKKKYPLIAALDLDSLTKAQTEHLIKYLNAAYRK